MLSHFLSYEAENKWYFDTYLIFNEFQGLQNIIKPDIQPDEVQEFLWRHMLRNIHDLQRILNRSTDDAFLLMHLIVNNITLLNTGAWMNMFIIRCIKVV